MRLSTSVLNIYFLSEYYKSYVFLFFIKYPAVVANIQNLSQRPPTLQKITKQQQQHQQQQQTDT